MKVLVTGSEGSLMQAVIPVLLAEGHEVTGVDNFARHGRIDRSRAYAFVEGDLTDPATVDRVMQGVEGVIQGAATLYGGGAFHHYPASILSNDLTLHANILRAARRRGVARVAYISSSMMYERATRVPSAEEDAEQFGIPATDYGLSKLVGERMSRAFWQEFGLEYVLWRPFNIITPWERGDVQIGKSHAFADFIEAICVRRERAIPIIGDGEQVRCFTWIDDVAEAIARFSFRDEARNDAFNLGNPRPITMKELARAIFRRAQDRGLFPPDAALTFRPRPAIDGDVRRRIPDVAKVKRVFGWEARVDVDEALDRCVDHALGPAPVLAATA